MSGILLANIAFILVFYKELKLATFDAPLAGVLGFAPGLLHYLLMTLVSVTAVGAFDAVGSILVVALMIAPPATAYLVVDRLSRMLALAALFGVASAVAGYRAAHLLDVSIAGSMATVAGLLFVLTYLFAPQRGLVAAWRRRGRQRVAFAGRMLAVHLFHHEGLPEEARENSVAHLHERLRWEHAFVGQVVRAAERDGVVTRRNDRLFLTEGGRRLAGEAIAGEPVD
jgi:manganese/zinc/iron transport system permease protein